MLHMDIDFAKKSLTFGQDYDRAIEALHASINPVNGRAAQQRRALGLKDLIIKVGGLLLPVSRTTLTMSSSRFRGSLDTSFYSRTYAG